LAESVGGVALVDEAPDVWANDWCWVLASVARDGSVLASSIWVAGIGSARASVVAVNWGEGASSGWIARDVRAGVWRRADERGEVAAS